MESVKSTIMATVRKFVVISEKLNLVLIFASGNYAQKLIDKLHSC